MSRVSEDRGPGGGAQPRGGGPGTFVEGSARLRAGPAQLAAQHLAGDCFGDFVEELDAEVPANGQSGLLDPTAAIGATTVDQVGRTAVFSAIGAKPFAPSDSGRVERVREVVPIVRHGTNTVSTCRHCGFITMEAHRNPECSRGRKPPVSSRLLTMW
jgi:hypothetical protein